MRTLIPSYLPTNHINSLRYQLCEIIYHEYKFTTFRLDELLEQKTKMLVNINKFIQTYPEITQYKDNSAYWYPYEKVDSKKDLQLYASFFPNMDNEITYFSSTNKNIYDDQDYLFDPVKLQFFLMCKDINTMRIESDMAQEIIQLNNEIFVQLLDIVGDTMSYNHKNTIEHIDYYINHSLQGENEAHEKYKDDVDLKNEVIRAYQKFNPHIHLFNEIKSCLSHYSLNKTLPQTKEQAKPKL